MKKSIYLFVFVLITLFVVDRGLYFVLHSLEKKIKTGDNIGRINHFYKVKDSVDLLVFGSSRAVHHLDSDLLLNTANYNMGVDGKRIGFVSGLISTLVKKEQILLIHIDHAKIFDANYKGKDVYSLLNKSFEDEKMTVFFKEFFPEEILVSRLVKCYVYNGKVLSILKNYKKEENKIFKNGYIPLTPSELQKNVFVKMLKEKQNYVHKYPSLTVNSRVESFIEKILEVAKKNNSKIIFFTSPSLGKVDANMKEMTKLFFEEKGIIYIDDIDFFGGVSSNTNVEFWKDYTHLSSKGADTYTIGFGKKLEAYGVIGSVNDMKRK